MLPELPDCWDPLCTATSLLTRLGFGAGSKHPSKELNVFGWFKIAEFLAPFIPVTDGS